MGIEEVKHHIGEEAKQKAKLLMNEADAEAKRIQQQTTQQLKEYKEQQKAHAAQVVEVAKKKELASAEFEGKRLVLDKKKAMITAAVDETKKKLDEMKTAERKHIIEKLLRRAQRELDVHSVVVNTEDVSLVTLSGVTVRASGISGGLIAENKSETISIDLSFDTLLEETKQRHLNELSEVLFR
ncbi:MAG TPA: V-type ATP synthase subunit E family protein [Candidatus Nanoarchaeia archaeon]|nr:V-type ATP synthase subunit E family protein [Candidatus Nanoarchaeia archaeon]